LSHIPAIPQSPKIFWGILAILMTLVGATTGVIYADLDSDIEKNSSVTLANSLKLAKINPIMLDNMNDNLIKICVKLEVECKQR